MSSAPEKHTRLRLNFPIACIIAITAAQITVTLLLFLLEVPLGKTGKFTYLYAQLVFERALNSIYLIPVAGLLSVGIAALFYADARRRRLGIALVAIGCVAAAAWTYFAPPSFFEQHVFNLVSPSHDGAFVWEADQTDDLFAYARDYPAYLRTERPRWGGTRVISNPPGTMLLAFGTRKAHEHWPRLVEWLGPELQADAPRKLAVALLFSYVLTLLWLLAALPWAASLAHWLAPAGVAVAAFCIVFNPMTVMFTPGKDAGQLLTVGLIFGMWWSAYQRGRVLSALLAGLALLLGIFFSLVHVWIAFVLVCTALWNCFRHDPARRLLLVGTVLIASGAILLGCAAGWLAGIDLLAIVRSVAAGQAEVTRGPNAMPFAWQALGVPLFLLFAGPATLFCLVAPVAKSMRHEDQWARLGRALVAVTVIVMLATVGFTNVETPRLWIPFAALLLAGGALQLRAFRAPAPADQQLLIWLVLAQVVTIGVQWTLMDMREAETRLIQIGEDARYWW